MGLGNKPVGRVCTPKACADPTSADPNPDTNTTLGADGGDEDEGSGSLLDTDDLAEQTTLCKAPSAAALEYEARPPTATTDRQCQASVQADARRMGNLSWFPWRHLRLA